MVDENVGSLPLLTRVLGADLVIVDLFSLTFEGLSTMADALDSDDRTQVLALSASPLILETALMLGASKTLLKPASISDIVTCVDDTLKIRNADEIYAV